MVRANTTDAPSCGIPSRDPTGIPKCLPRTHQNSSGTQKVWGSEGGKEWPSRSRGGGSAFWAIGSEAPRAEGYDWVAGCAEGGPVGPGLSLDVSRGGAGGGDFEEFIACE